MFRVYASLKDHSIPVHEDDTRDEEGKTYGEEVCKRHVVGQMLGQAVQRGSIRHRGILPSTVFRHGVVTVVPIVHHCVGEIALRQNDMDTQPFIIITSEV